MKNQKDNKSNLTRELNKFSKKIFDAVKAIMELPETEQMYLWHLVFHYEQYNETTNPKFAQHFRSLDTDEKYKKKCDEYYEDGEMREHLLHPLLRGDLFSGMKHAISGGGGGRWRKTLNTITTRYDRGEYV